MSRYQTNKIKIKLSMTTSNYKLDTRYALVDTYIINDKKNIFYTEAITFYKTCLYCVKLEIEHQRI